VSLKRETLKSTKP